MRRYLLAVLFTLFLAAVLYVATRPEPTTCVVEPCVP